MRVAWVEDDGGQFKDGVKAFVGLLDKISLSREDDLLTRFDDLNSSDDLSSENISNFFETNTLHNLEWFDRYSGMQSRISDQSKYRWDVVILDLNLEHGFEKEEFSVEPTTAGFALYVQLLRAGFPPENIIFSTNNSKQTEGLVGVCDRYDIPKARYLDKLKLEQLEEWLRSHLENEHLMLRRGILDGCSYMMTRLLDDPAQSIRINQCCESNSDEFFLNAQSLKNWLEAWPKLLPRAASSKNNEYAVFLLALLTMWDGKIGIPSQKNVSTNSSALAQALRSVLKPSDEGDANEGFSVIPFILKWARNWIAHNNSLHDSSLHAAAFFFLLAGRGLVCNSSNSLRHEKILLRLIEGQKNSERLSKLNDRELLIIKSDLFDMAKESVEYCKNETRLSAYRDKKFLYFNQMANDYVLNASALNFHYSPEELLMLSLLIDAKATKGSFISDFCIALKNFLPIRNKSISCASGGALRLSPGTFLQQPDDQATIPKARTHPMSEVDMIDIVKDAISHCADDIGWALTSNVGNYMSGRYPNFKNWLIVISNDYLKISSFVDAHPDIFEVSSNGSGTKYAAACIRLK